MWHCARDVESRVRSGGRMDSKVFNMAWRGGGSRRHAVIVPVYKKLKAAG